MKRILFIHSAGAQGDTEGSGRFLAKLRPLMAGVELSTPAMPNPEAPSAGPWIDAVSRLASGMDAPFALLGHSLGGSIILKQLAEHGVPDGLAGVVAYAPPFWGAPDWGVPEFALPEDAGRRLAGVTTILLFGRSDEVVTPDHLDLYRAAIPTAACRLIEGDHEFTTGDMIAVRDAISSLPGFGTTMRER